jgi:FtsP/CotA-like multicopper oxidase with cupredoxin domain
MITRRGLLARAALLTGGATFLSSRSTATQGPDPRGGHHGHTPMPTSAAQSVEARWSPPAPTRGEVRELRRRLGYTPVTTPDGASARWRWNGDWKEFHLVAHEVEQEFAPGMKVKVWGYNGGSPGPTLEAVEGDRVRIFVTNHLPEHTTIHWHGLFLPNGMDGVGGLLQPHIRPGETYVYEFELRQHGTFMYHPHADEMVQMALGMMGFFVIHPRAPRRQPIDRDFCIFPHMWAIRPGTYRPDPSVMLDFDIFTLNGRAYPGTTPMVVRQGERVRLRFANVGMTSHPMHIHGHRFWVVETDGGQVPETAWVPESSLNIVSGQTRAVDFVAELPGDWPLHCHKTHHAMNAMGHSLPNPIGAATGAAAARIERLVDGYMAMGESGMAEHAAHAAHREGPENTLPMMTGTGPFGAIEMGGMFTLFKIRPEIESYADPGWYDHPAGTVARPAEPPEGLSGL